MNNTQIKLSFLLLTGIVTGTNNLKAAYHYFDDLWADMDSLMQEHRQEMARIRDQMSHIAHDADTVKLAKFETVQLPTVKTELKQDDANIILHVTIAQPEKPKQADQAKTEAQDAKKEAPKAEDINLNKDKIEITPEENNTLDVLIPLAKSFVRIAINRHQYSVTKGIQTQEETKNSFYSSTHERLVKADILPAAVALGDTKNIKAVVDQKTNTLTITLPKKKTTKIPVTVTQ